MRRLTDEERLSSRVVVALTEEDRRRLGEVAARNNLPVARLAREALLTGLGVVATRRRQTRHARRKAKEEATV